MFKGKIDRSKLVQKQIVDKRGRKTTKWVRKDGGKTKPKDKSESIKNQIRELYKKKIAGTITDGEVVLARNLVNSLSKEDKESIHRELNPELANRMYGRKVGDAESPGSLQDPKSLSDKQIKDYIAETVKIPDKKLNRNLEIVREQIQMASKQGNIRAVKKLNAMASMYTAAKKVKEGRSMDDAVSMVRGVIDMTEKVEGAKAKASKPKKSKARKKVEAILERLKEKHGVMDAGNKTDGGKDGSKKEGRGKKGRDEKGKAEKGKKGRKKSGLKKAGAEDSTVVGDGLVGDERATGETKIVPPFAPQGIRI